MTKLPNKKTIAAWSRFGWAHYKHAVMRHIGETDFSKDLPREYIDAFPHGLNAQQRREKWES